MYEDCMKRQTVKTYKKVAREQTPLVKTSTKVIPNKKRDMKPLEDL
jgi:hypothetical protein